MRLYPHQCQLGMLGASQQHRERGEGLSVAGDASSTITGQQMWGLENGYGPFLRERCMRDYGWDASKAQRALRAYWQFQQIKKIYKDYDSAHFLPSLSVDQMWCERIMDVPNYEPAWVINECCRAT
jgi:hypothetical protein